MKCMKWPTLVLSAVLGWGVGAVPVPAQAQVQLDMAIGTVGGTMYRLGAGLTEVFNGKQEQANISLVPGGGAANPARVGTGAADFGFTFSNFAMQAYRGREPFDQEFKNLRHVAAFWGACHHQYIAREVYEAGIRSWEDIVTTERSLAIGPGRAGTSTAAINDVILEHLGITHEELERRGHRLQFLGVGAMSEQYRSGHLDIWFHNAGAPNAAGIEAAIGRDTTFMDMPDSLKGALSEAGFSECDIPGGAYENIDEPHPSMGALGVLVTTEDMDPEVVYNFLKLTNENLAFLGDVDVILKSWTPQYGVAAYGLPLHEGAERFYKEVGAIN